MAVHRTRPSWMCRIARRSADQPHTLAQQCRQARTAKPGTLGHMHARRMHALLLERLSPYTDPSQPPRCGRQSWAHPRLPHLHRDWARPCHICTGTGLTPRLPHLHRNFGCHGRRSSTRSCRPWSSWTARRSSSWRSTCPAARTLWTRRVRCEYPMSTPTAR